MHSPDDIEGYRALNADEIRAINELKDMGKDIGEHIAGMRMNDEYDQRWVAIGATHMQQGLMALVRGIARPETF